MDELVDKEAELKRLNKELETAKKELAMAEGKLANEKFVSKAPQAVVDKVKATAEKMTEKISLIEAAMSALK